MSKKPPIKKGKGETRPKTSKTDYLPVVLFLSIGLLTFLAYFSSLGVPLIFVLTWTEPIK